MHTMSLNEYLAPCCDLARDAGALIMRYFDSEFDMRHKEDNSPVTNADTEANLLITNALKKLSPHIPVIAEEDEELGQDYLTGSHSLFWLVDPLDGTRSFVRGEPEFTVNIGLIRDGAPLLGVIYAPPQDTLYYGQVGQGAFRRVGHHAPEPIHARAPQPDGVTVVRSKSHPSPATEAYLKTLKVKEMSCGGSSLKICMVAEGSADIYPRFGRTMEWDTAAGHAILIAAGGRMETPGGAPLAYGKPGFENPHFIAFGAKG